MKVDIGALGSYSANTKESHRVDGARVGHKYIRSGAIWISTLETSIQSSAVCRPWLVPGGQVSLYPEQRVKYRDSLVAYLHGLLHHKALFIYHAFVPSPHFPSITPV